MEARIFNQACWIFDIESFRPADEFKKLLIQSRFSIFGDIEYNFVPMGYTKLWLLGESHLALHTFPENNILYVELSSCVEEYASIFWENVQKWSLHNSKKILLMKKNNYEIPINNL